MSQGSAAARLAWMALCFGISLFPGLTHAGIRDYVPGPVEESGLAEVKVTFVQSPVLTTAPSIIAGTPDQCQVRIPFQGTVKLLGGQTGKYWVVHSDGTKSDTRPLPAANSPQAISYEWFTKAPPNQPFSGWAMLEAETYFGQKGHSPKASFTVTCVPQKPAQWSTAPLIVSPKNNQQVFGGQVVIRPRNELQSHCADGGSFLVTMQLMAQSPSRIGWPDWQPLPMMQPLQCVSEGSTKSLAGVKPGRYRLRAQEQNPKHNFTSDWSSWVEFEIVGRGQLN